MGLLSFDLETHQKQPGLLTPPIVCGSFTRRDEADKFQSELLRTDAVIERVARELENTENLWVGANITYDWGCILAVRPDLFEHIWLAYEEARVYDVLIAATLNAIADGRIRNEGGGSQLFRFDGSIIPKGAYNLQEVTREWTGRHDAKRNDRWRKSYYLLEHLRTEEWPWDAQQYPIDDVENALESCERQLAKPARNLEDLPVQVHAAFSAHLGSIWGLRTNPARVSEFKAAVEAKLVELEVWAESKGFMRRKTKKPDAELSVHKKVVQEAVFKAYNGHPPCSPGGGVSTAREVLEDSGDPLLEKFIDVNRWRKFETYIPALEEAAAQPYNVECNILLNTGRASYRGMIQLMPRDNIKFEGSDGKRENVISLFTGQPIGVRQCFEARPGHVLSSVDYEAIEMSTLAQVCLWTVGFSDLADAINNDMDPHSILGADLVGSTYNAFLARIIAKEYAAREIRQAGKKGNFGFPGMMGDAKFVIAQKRAGDLVCEWFYRDGRCGEERVMEWKGRETDMPLCVRCLEKAAVIRDAYLNRWSEMRPYWDWVSNEVDNNDCIVQFISGRIRGSPYAPAAANSYFQGLAADGAKRALIKMTREMYLRGPKLERILMALKQTQMIDEMKPIWGSNFESPLYGSRSGVFAHDETILEIPESNSHDGAYRQADIMVVEMKKLVPNVKVKAKPALMRNWWKSADTVHDSNGKLVCWEPPVQKAA
jgi:DNA polymerase-1